jgi:hypothetical protein
MMQQSEQGMRQQRQRSLKLVQQLMLPTAMAARHCTMLPKVTWQQQ